MPTEVAFFGSKAATRLREQSGTAGLIIVMLGYVADINDFVASFKILLGEQGVATFEFPHVLEMIRNVGFDTIYHEHTFICRYWRWSHCSGAWIAGG